ncbi:MAG: cell division protein ZapA [Methylococcales symbiont of Iophon sp. n. MRB-2018]|nr:MAG: cell division protein ZapA [Methylococcales symbiont of Iophon sp. n. MRB-2018]KAF3979267.1 MAG: cell division protein ZapA [Methylococcales symbiont of Iophon sp. n. MRB-2018]
MNTNTNPQPVSINILGKDYRVTCAVDEEETLIRSAQKLDQQMREIRASGKVNGTDRIAVMAALNLTNELHLAQRNKTTAPISSISSKLANLRHKIEKALENH